MISFKILLLGLALLAAGVSAGQLTFTNVAIGDVNRDIIVGQPPTFIDVKPNAGPNGDSYQLQLQLKNLGKESQIQGVDVQVFAGSYDKNVPSDAQIISIDTSKVNQNLPKIGTNQNWPDGGFTVFIPGTTIPETTACSPYDVTIGVNTTFLADNVQTREEDLIPVRVVPKCLSVTTSASGDQLPVKITFSSPFVETNNAELPFLVDFGDKVLELNPLKLVNVTGSNRTDLVYAVEEGKIYLMVYPDDSAKQATITVNVVAGATTNAAGVPNGAASLTAVYKPKIGGIRTAALVLTGVFAGTILASWFTSFVVSSMQPWATAGSLGYGAIAFVVWAQKLYLSGLFNTPLMPANYRTLSDTFAWSDFQLSLPWTWGSDSVMPGVTKNLTTDNAIFETNGVVLLDSRTSNYVFYYANPSGANASLVLSPPPPAALPPSTLLPSDTGTSIPVAITTPPPAVPITSPPPPPVVDPGAVQPISPDPNAAIAAPPPAPANQDSCSVLQNTDFYGGDLPNTNIQTTDPQECCNACIANPACYVWTLSFVQNQCYLKGQGGWQQRSSMTCCLSGVVNRGGVPASLPGLSTAAANGGTPSGINDDINAGIVASPAPRTPDGNNNNNNNKNRRMLSKVGVASPCGIPTLTPAQQHQIRQLQAYDLQEQEQQQAGHRHILQTPIIPSVVTPENTRYIVTSSVAGYSPKSSKSQLVVLQNMDAGGKVKYIVNTASSDNTIPGGNENNIYEQLEEVGFWFACILLVACLFNVFGWMFVKCCEGELPGVLYVPRMQLTLIMFVLSAISYVGARLFSGGYGIVPMCVGIAIVVCCPVLFLLASYIGIAAALYRKRKAVYLLSSRASTEEPSEHTKWDLQVVGGWMGMSLNRGKWRPSDPSRKNEFVFRWGALFEDCRGPLYQRRKNPTNGSSMSLRRVHTSSASDHSSQSGTPYVANEGALTRSTSRRKVAPLEEKPLLTCCACCSKHKVRRSSFQAYGVVVSFARLCLYALAIGGLGSWPIAQSATCCGLAILYIIYLRFAVPYSRRDEMALEYWVALLDIILFVLILVLSAGVKEDDFNTVDGLGIGLIVIQCLGFFSYLVNRLLIIVHAFMEVVLPSCACGTPSPRKSRRSRSGRSRSGISRSESMGTYSMSDVTLNAMQGAYTTDGKNYFLPDGTPVALDGKDGDSVNGLDSPEINSGIYAAPQQGYMLPPQNNASASLAAAAAAAAHGGALAMDSRASSRSARSGGPGMFPAIVEETDSQISSPVAGLTTNTGGAFGGAFGASGGGGGAPLPAPPLSSLPQGQPAPGGPPSTQGGASLQGSELMTDARAEGTPRSRPVVVVESPERPSSQQSPGEIPPPPQPQQQHPVKDNAVFNKFWKSL